VSANLWLEVTESKYPTKIRNDEKRRGPKKSWSMDNFLARVSMSDSTPKVESRNSSLRVGLSQALYFGGNTAARHKSVAGATGDFDQGVIDWGKSRSVGVYVPLVDDWGAEDAPDREADGREDVPRSQLGICPRPRDALCYQVRGNVACDGGHDLPQGGCG
jgi:hypothetical protein